MLGFIKKDMYVIKANLKMLAAILIVFVLMVFGGQINISFLFPFMIVMLFVSTFSYDDFNHWNAYAITFPNGRKNIVRGKYVANLLMTALSFGVSFAILFCVSLVKHADFSFTENMKLLIETWFGIVLVISIMFPILFKFGSEKGRIWLFVGVFSISFCVGFLSKHIDLSSFDLLFHFVEGHVFGVIGTVSVIILLFSYLISRRIVARKEY